MEQTAENALNGYAAEVVNAWDRDGRRLMDLARRMGVTPGYITRLRRTQSGLGLRSAIGLSRTLGASVEELERRALAWHAAGRPPLRLKELLEAGMASALFRVDSAKPGPAPRLDELLEKIPDLPRLPPPNKKLL